MKGPYFGLRYSALEIAKERNHTEVALLLEKLQIDIVQTRHGILVKLGVLDERAAELFAMAIFLCDNLLQLKPALTASSNPEASTATRFFKIARQLPMELQMVSPIVLLALPRTIFCQKIQKQPSNRLGRSFISHIDCVLALNSVAWLPILNPPLQCIVMSRFDSTRLDHLSRGSRGKPDRTVKFWNFGNGLFFPNRTAKPTGLTNSSELFTITSSALPCNTCLLSFCFLFFFL